MRRRDVERRARWVAPAMLAGWAVAGWAATFTVGTAGPDCAAPSHGTIAAALTAAGASGSGHTIQVCPGSYAESNLSITQAGHAGLTLRAVSGNPADVTINPASCSSGRVIYVTRSNVTLQGLTLRPTASGCDGVYADDAASLTARDMVISATDDGIYVDGWSPGIVFSNLTVAAGTTNNNHAIYLDGEGSTAVLSRITVTAAGGNGIYVRRRWNGATLTDIDVTTNNYGVQIEDSQHSVINVATLARNTITAANDGIRFRGDTGTFRVYDTTISAGSDSTNDNAIQARDNVWGAWEIRRVTINASRGGAIRVEGGGSPQLSDLDIRSESEGIYLQDAQNPTITNAVIQSGNTGIRLAGDVGTFVVRGAEIAAGTDQAGDHGIRATNVWGAYEVSGSKISAAGGSGIYVENGGNSGRIFNNSVRGVAGYGLRLLNSNQWTGTRVYNNCFFATPGSNDAYNRDQNAVYYNGTVGNYWGSATGSTGFSETCADANSDGICDATYAVPGTGSRVDNYPLKTTPAHCLAATFDHLLIEHDGSAVSCAAEAIVVKACGNPDCSTLYTGGVAGSITAGSNSVAFAIPAGDADVAINLHFPFDTGGADPQTVRLGAAGVLPVAVDPASPYCRLGGGSPNATTACDVSVYKAGFVFDVPHLFAGQASDAVAVRAVRSSDGSTCVPLFANVTRTVAFWGGYEDPGSGTLPLRLNGSAIETTTTPAYTSTVALSFDANGEASLASVRYDDVGLMRLSARYVGNAGNTPPDGGVVMTGSDTFVVRPHHFDLSGIKCTTADAAHCGAGALPSGNNPAASDAAGPSFIRAGDPFTVVVTARNALGDATPNYGQELDPEGVKLTAALVAGLGLTGNPAITNATAFGSFTNGVATGATFAWDEVGVVTLVPSVADGDYLGAGDVTGTASGPVGRFFPHHFALESGGIGNRADIGTTGDMTAGSPILTVASANCAAPGARVVVAGAGAAGADLAATVLVVSGTAVTLSTNAATTVAAANVGLYPGIFTYMDEPFLAWFNLRAESLDDSPTANYATAATAAANFAKLDGAAAADWLATGTGKIGVGARDDGGPTALTGRLAVDAGAGGFAGGVGAFQAKLKLNRIAGPDGPFDAFKLGIAPVDSDGVALAAAALDLDADLDGDADRALIGTSRVRLGRLRMLNAYGSELLPIRVPLRAEYYRGGGWATHVDDSCTAVPASSLALLNCQGGLAAQCSAVGGTPNAGTVMVSPATISLQSGMATMVLTRPACPATPADCRPGTMDLGLNLGAATDLSCNGSHPASIGAAQPWLRADWCRGTVDPNAGDPANDPNARVRFGSPRAPYIFMKERY